MKYNLLNSFVNMKKFFEQPELMVVRTNDDIVTASNIGIGNNPVNSGNQVQGPDRRRSIWD